MTNKKTDRACVECRTAMTGPTEAPFRYTITPDWAVTLEGVARWTCPKCGNHEDAIRGVDALHKAIAACVVRKRTRLAGPELKFLREQILDQTGVGVSKLLGVTLASWSRWENGKTPIGVVPERLLRVLAVLHLDDNHFESRELLEIDDADASRPMRIRLREKAGRWVGSEAA